MNDNELTNNNSTSRYKATRNLNTEIENPEININSAVGINIQDVNENNQPINNPTNNYFNENINQTTNDPSFINQNINNNLINQNNTYIPNNNENYNVNISYNNYDNIKEVKNSETYVPVEEKEIYQPTLKEKKKQKSFQLPSELKVMIFIIFILLIFILIVPYIYNFVKEIELSILR